MAVTAAARTSAEAASNRATHQPEPGLQRRQLRRQRRQLSKQQQRRAAQQLAQRLAHAPWFLHASRIGFYWPADGELDPRPLLQRAVKAGKSCYLPVLRYGTWRSRGGKLWFAGYVPGESLRRNRFGIPEPQPRGRRLRLVQALDLLLLPLVGFDDQCHRIGMGGGFYDRTLGYRRLRHQYRLPRLLGIAHACQQLPGIAPRPWDIPLDAVCTPEKTYHCSQFHRLRR